MSNENSNRSRQLSWVIIIIILLVSVTVVAVNINPGFVNHREPITTFWVSFIVGLGGASVYLALLLMTEKNLSILENDIIDDIYLMSIFFILSGGFVSAITQTTTGPITMRSLQGIFMIGFGWQGALTGVASSGTRIKLIEDHKEETNFLSDNTNSILVAKDRKISELTEEIKEMSKELSTREGE